MRVNNYVDSVKVGRRGVGGGGGTSLLLEASSLCRYQHMCWPGFFLVWRGQMSRERASGRGAKRVNGGTVHERTSAQRAGAPKKEGAGC